MGDRPTVAERTEMARNSVYEQTYKMPGNLWAEQDMEKSIERAESGKDRPWMARQNRPDVDGDWNQRNISLAMDLMSMALSHDIDLTDADELPLLVDRFKEVWMLLSDYGMKPMLTHFSACLGISGRALKEATTLGITGAYGAKKVAPEVMSFLQKIMPSASSRQRLLSQMRTGVGTRSATSS